MRRQQSSAMDPLHAERITDGADVGRAGLVGVMVDEPIEEFEQLGHLGWWRVFEQEGEEGEVAKGELIYAFSVHFMVHGAPLATVEQLQDDIQKVLGEAVSEYTDLARLIQIDVERPRSVWRAIEARKEASDD